MSRSRRYLQENNILRKIMWKIKAAKSHVGWFHSNNLKLVRIDNHDTNYTNFHRHCLE